MLLAIPPLVVLILVFGPQLWVRYLLRKHGHPRPDLPGTGGELAQHLVNRFCLDASVIKSNTSQDYYDPEQRIVCLSPEYYDGRSIAAVAVAAHEVGHALQHHEQYPGFIKRQRRIKIAMAIERFSSIAFVVTPVIFLITRIPQSSLLTLFIGGSGMLAALWVQCMNLPVEKDASFHRALPILQEGYLLPQDLPAVREVLKAAAFTYVAAALANLLSVSRWIAILRR